MENAELQHANVEALSLIGLLSLMRESRGDPSISVGIIDGPVDFDHPAFAGASFQIVNKSGSAACTDMHSLECAHGTAIAGVLCAERGFTAPAICPSCRFFFYPIFPQTRNGHSGRTYDLSATTPSHLAQAIFDTVDAGARIINLSLAVLPVDLAVIPELNEACDYAAKKDVILVAAAGNQGRMGYQPLLSHSWIIPIVSCSSSGAVAPESNLSPAIARRGLRAPGVSIWSTAPNNSYTQISGTSVAAAIATGSLALLWSKNPGMPAVSLKEAVMQIGRSQRRSIIPPLMDMSAADEKWSSIAARMEGNMSRGTIQVNSDEFRRPETSRPVVRPMSYLETRGNHGQSSDRVISQNLPCPTCGPEATQNSGPPAFIFAIGQVRMRFPSPSVEKEFAQSIATSTTAGLTDQAVLYTALREQRYLANEVCWIFVVDSIETYILVPRDQYVLEQIVDAMRPAERGIDTDVVVGSLGPVAPPEMCNGLSLPMVLVDRIWSFTKPELMGALTKPAKSKMTDDEFRQSSDDVFDRIQQLADNVGATDEHRALNYLAVRYQQIYTQTSDMLERDFALSRVEVTPSRLSLSRKLVNVIFTYTNRKTDVEEKYRVRVDVTEKYPYLEKGITQYYDRD